MPRRNRRQRSRRATPKELRECSICCNNVISSIYPIIDCPQCQSVQRCNVCEICFCQYIIRHCSNGSGNPINCPEFECESILSMALIRDILIRYGEMTLWNEYYERYNWKGTTDEWMRRFTAECLNCRVPIDKNGGCDTVKCTRCRTTFSWVLARIRTIIKAKVLKTADHSSFYNVSRTILRFILVLLQLIILFAIIIFIFSGPNLTYSMLLTLFHRLSNS